MKLFITLLLFSTPSHATYVSKFWLSPKSQQVQISNLETKSMLMLYLEYDALKMFLYNYEIIHAGQRDPILSEIKGPLDFHKIMPLIGRVDYISMTHERFGDLDEDFISRSVFGQKTNLIFDTEKQMDIFLIKRLLTTLFRNEAQLKRAKNITSCQEYL